MTDSLSRNACPSPDVPHADHLGGQSMAFQSGAVPRTFRGDPRKHFSSDETKELVGSALDEAYKDEPSKYEAIARDTGKTPRAIENWLRGDCTMSLPAFLSAYHNNPAFKAWARKLLLLEQETDPEFQIELSRFMDAVRRKG